VVDDATKELNARFVHEVISLVKPLYLRALQFTRNRTDAEDLLQGTCSRPRPESAHSARDQPEGMGCIESCSMRTSIATARGSVVVSASTAVSGRHMTSGQYNWLRVHHSCACTGDFVFKADS
jgi:hypothetical protein